MYDSGSVFSPEILDISDDDLLKKFTQVIKKLLSMIKLTNHNFMMILALPTMRHSYNF